MRGGRLLAGLVAVIAAAASAPSHAAAATGCDTRSYHAPHGRMHLSVRSAIAGQFFRILVRDTGAGCLTDDINFALERRTASGRWVAARHQPYDELLPPFQLAIKPGTVGSFNGYVPGDTPPGRYRVVKHFETLALYAQFDVVARGGRTGGGADVTFPVTRAARKLLPGATLTVPVMGSGGPGATARLTLWRLRGADQRVLVARQTVSMGTFSKRVTTSEDAFYLLELRTGTTTKTAVLTTVSPCAIDGTGMPTATIALSTATAVPGQIITYTITNTSVSWCLFTGAIDYTLERQASDGSWGFVRMVAPSQDVFLLAPGQSVHADAFVRPTTEPGHYRISKIVTTTAFSFNLYAEFDVVAPPGALG